MHRHRHRQDPRTLLLYVRAIVWEFRWTLIIVFTAVLFGGLLYAITPHESLGGRRPPILTCLFGGWMALLAQPILAPPETWYLTLIAGFYPLIGFVVIGEGIVRLALLVSSKEHGEKEWMKVMASTYRDHVVLCGIGHLGYRVLEQLVASGVPVVVIEKDADCRFLSHAKGAGVPVLLRDMKDDSALLEAGVPHARVVIIATNDDMANIEVGLDARRMNSKIRILMRLYDQQIAAKISGALSIDTAFSASALAAPIVAAMSLDTRVVSSFLIGSNSYSILEVTVEAGSAVAGRRIAQLEKDYNARVLARTPSAASVHSPPAFEEVVSSGDTLVISLETSRLPALAAECKLKNRSAA